MSIKAIIFDCFGVLAGKSYKAIYQEAGGDLEKDSEFINDVLSAANQGLMSSRDMHQHVADRLGLSYDVWYQTVQDGEQPNEELLQYVRQLKSNYKIGVLSNANVGTLDRKFSREQMKLFDTVMVSAEVGMIKPNAEIYQLTAERLGVRPAEVVFTDDSEVYCEAAKATGMQAIHYKNLLQFKHDLEAILSQTS